MRHPICIIKQKIVAPDGLLWRYIQFIAHIGTLDMDVSHSSKFSAYMLSIIAPIIASLDGALAK